jgi:hypothetical protein
LGESSCLVLGFARSCWRTLRGSRYLLRRLRRRSWCCVFGDVRSRCLMKEGIRCPSGPRAPRRLRIQLLLDCSLCWRRDGEADGGFLMMLGFASCGDGGGACDPTFFSILEWRTRRARTSNRQGRRNDIVLAPTGSTKLHSFNSPRSDQSLTLLRSTVRKSARYVVFSAAIVVTANTHVGSLALFRHQMCSWNHGTIDYG